MNLERKTFDLGTTFTGLETKVVDSVQGIVTAFVSVTGNRDKGGDVILAGAHAWGLKQVTPKGIWSHDWTTPISKTVEAVEYLPGDKALPSSLLAAGLGGLYIKTQFNLASAAGEEAFKTVGFFGEEQEWSIGYEAHGAFYAGAKVNTAAWDQLKSKLPAATVALINGLDEPTRFLPKVIDYEYSPVLFGMNPLTVTGSVKDASEDRVARLERIVLSLPGIKSGAPELDQKEAAMLEVKIWVEASSLPGTIEAFTEAVREAGRTWLDENVTRAPEGEQGAYPWLSVVATYPDSVVVRISGLIPDPVTKATEEHLAFPLTYDGTTVTLGTPQVAQVTVSISVGAAAGPQTDAAPTVGSASAEEVVEEGWREVEEAISYLAADVTEQKVTPAQARRQVERARAALDAMASLIPGIKPAEESAPVTEASAVAVVDEAGHGAWLELLAYEVEAARAVL